VKSEASKLSTFWQEVSVFGWPQLLPAFSNCVTSALTGATHFDVRFDFHKFFFSCSKLSFDR